MRAAMVAQARIEGRYLGDRPPYDYMLVYAGPHPNPAKAVDGKRLHQLDPDPITAAVVERILARHLDRHRDLCHRPAAHRSARRLDSVTLHDSQQLVRGEKSPRAAGNIRGV